MPAGNRSCGTSVRIWLLSLSFEFFIHQSTYCLTSFWVSTINTHNLNNAEPTLYLVSMTMKHILHYFRTAVHNLEQCTRFRSDVDWNCRSFFFFCENHKNTQTHCVDNTQIYCHKSFRIAVRSSKTTAIQICHESGSKRFTWVLQAEICVNSSKEIGVLILTVEHNYICL